MRGALLLVALLALGWQEAGAQFPPPFNPFPPTPILRALTVTKAGTGTGLVTAQVGIVCGSTCTHAYNNGATVILTPTVTAGNLFTGWSGACSGTGPCVILMNQARVAIATFTFAQSLAWNDNSTNEENFSLERRSPCDSGTFAVIAAPALDAQSYLDTTALPATAYEYRIQAVNSAGASAYSNQLCTP